MDYLENQSSASGFDSKNPSLEDAQCGFRPGRSCLDASWTLSQIVQARGRKKQKTYTCFVDMKKAYPRTSPDFVIKEIVDL